MKKFSRVQSRCAITGKDGFLTTLFFAVPSGFIVVVKKTFRLRNVFLRQHLCRHPFSKHYYDKRYSIHAMRIYAILLTWLVLSVVQLLNCQAALSAEKIPQESADNVSGCAATDSSANQKPFYAFEKAHDGFDPTSRGWHSEYEKNNNYAETWFFVVQTKQGGVLFVTLSVTNLGMRTFDGACDVRFFTANGGRYNTYAQYRRKDIAGARNTLDLTIGPNHLTSRNHTYHLTINEKDLQLDMTLKGVLPEYQFGNGRVFFYEDRSADWNIRFNAPRAIAKGVLTVDGKTLSLDGDGYHDHVWSTIKLPTFAAKWYSLRFYDERFSIILHQIHLTDTFGGGQICAGIIGDNDKLIPVRRFLYKPLNWRKEKTSGLQIPQELMVSIKTDGYTLSGTIKEARFLDSVDVLSRLSWPVRTAIKAFYTKPYMIRYQARCDIHLTDSGGARHHISGMGVVGTNYY
jgi:hypothetical protein